MFRTGAPAVGCEIFITYRTRDQPYAAALLYDFLAGRFGARRVFRDVNSGIPAADYPDTLRAALDSAKVLVAVIGPAWLDVRDGNGERLIDHESDWVRQELARAFERDIVVLPVLVAGTGRAVAMPAAAQLPADIRRLAKKHALTVDQTTLTRDLKPVANAIARRGKVRDRRWRIGMVTGRIALLCVIVGAVVAVVVRLGPQAPEPQQISDPSTIDPCTFAQPAQHALTGFGQVRIDAHADNFNVCDIFVDNPGTTEIEVPIVLEYPNSTGMNPVLIDHENSVTVKLFGNSECDRTMSQNSNYEIDVSANFVDDSNPTRAMCAITNAATTAITNFLNSGAKFTIRNPHDPTSLISLDACGLPDDSALHTIGVTTAGQPDLWNWKCSWGATGRVSSVQLRFDQGQSPTGQRSAFADFTGFTLPDGNGDGTDCQVEIEVRGIPSDPNNPEYEMVLLTVNGTESPSALCGPAQTLAEDVASHLR